MAMSVEGGRGRARRGGGTRDLQWVDNKPQSSSRCVRATLCCPLVLSLSLFLRRNWQIRKSTSGASSRASSPLVLEEEKRDRTLVVLAAVVVVIGQVRHSARARVYAITSASVHQARRGEDIPFWRYTRVIPLGERWREVRVARGLRKSARKDGGLGRVPCQERRRGQPGLQATRRRRQQPCVGQPVLLEYSKSP